MAIVDLKASTLGEVLDVTKAVTAKWSRSFTLDQEVWFRGQAKRDWELVPGLYRPEVQRCKYDEYTLMKDFWNLGEVHIAPRKHTEWEWYILAQHYRLPTRLLDWTESLLAAIYFAIASEMASINKLEYDKRLCSARNRPVYDSDSPALWLLDAGSLNAWSVGEDGLFGLDDPAIRQYRWDRLHKPAKGKRKRPIAITPPRQNPRILAQRGMFTVHGSGVKGIDRYAANDDPRGEIQLARICIDRANLCMLWHDLELAGGGRLMHLRPSLCIYTHPASGASMS